MVKVLFKSLWFDMVLIIGVILLFSHAFSSHPDIFPYSKLLSSIVGGAILGYKFVNRYKLDRELSKYHIEKVKKVFNNNNRGGII